MRLLKPCIKDNEAIIIYFLFTSYPATVGSCHIQEGLPTAVGTPTYGGQSRTIYSCNATDNCMYDVHVVSSYESISSYSHTAGTATVNLRVSGPSQGAKPLVLVFVTYEPVRWTLNVPSGVTIEKVLLVRD